MLLEHINHYNNLHFSIGFTNVAQEAPHYHKEMELVLVLRGYAKCKVHHQDFYIEAGDMFTVDTKDLHYIYESSEDVIMLQFHVDVAYFSDTYPNIDVMFFVCEDIEKEAPQRHQRLHNKISFLAHHIAEMMMLCQKGNNDKQLAQKLREFLFIMVDKFQAFFIENNEVHHGKEDINPLDLERLYRIMHYMYTNYEKKITLYDIVEMEHLSMHYISHFIKKTSGLSFQNLLNYIRVEQAEKLLNENKLTLTQISEFCGFSSLTYFNKCFATWHHVTPAQYRKQSRPQQRAFHAPIDYSQALMLLQSYLNTDLPDAAKIEPGYATNHILIPMQARYQGTKAFHKTFPLHILVETPQELMKAVYYRNELRHLSPDTITIAKPALSDEDGTNQILFDLKRSGIDTIVKEKNDIGAVRKASAETVADAFAQVLAKPDMNIKLFGKTCALFTQNGLPAPFYSLYTAFNGLEGMIGEQQRQYLLVSSEDWTSLIMHQTDSEADLNFHLQFNPSNCPAYIIKKTFGANQNINAATKLLGSPQQFDHNVRKHLVHFTAGTTEFIPASGFTNFRLNIAVESNTLVILELPQNAKNARNT